MLICWATLTAALILCALMGIYARRQHIIAHRERTHAGQLRINLQRSASMCAAWRAEVKRLRGIVDRVEGI